MKILKNKEAIGFSYKYHQCKNDGWYYHGSWYEPEELPESWLEELKITLNDGYNLEVGDTVQVAGTFVDYHPKIGTFTTTGEWDMKVRGHIGDLYYLIGVDEK